MKKTIILLAFVSISAGLFAQTNLKITGGNLKITSDVDIVLQNTKWINNGTVTASDGAVILSGDAAQHTSSVEGTSETAFYNLTINKSANAAELNQNISIANTMSFMGGNFDLNGNNVTLGSSNGTIVGEDETKSFISSNNGVIQKTVNLNMPSNENPGNLGVTITSVANLGSTLIQRGHIAQSVNGTPGILRYYNITPTTNTGLNATVQFAYLDNELNGLSEMDLKLFQENAGLWDDLVLSDSNTITNYFTSSGIGTFSTWTLAGGLSLPVELISFTATPQERIISLNWKSAIETNFDGYELQRSSNGYDFHKIAWVEGNGNLEEAFYQFIDEQIHFNQLYYYRLKMIDLDQSFEFSPVRTAIIKGENEEISVFPNPAERGGSFNVENLYEENVRFLLFNSNGQMIKDLLIESDGILNVKLQGVTAGFFVYRIETSTGIETGKLIVH